MEVKPGYKLTEVGVIPEDWEVKKLGELTTTVASGRSGAGTDFGNYPVHGSTGIIGFTDSPEYIGDAIMVARVGANAGKLNAVTGKYGVTDNTIIIRFVSGLCLMFYLRLLELKQLNSLVFGSGQPLITGTQLKNLHVYAPPLPEQTAIATTLSDVDALISSLDALISKKKQIKQGAMQELLSGKRRLPGFSGEWGHYLFGNLFKFSGGWSASRDQLSQDGYCYLHYGDIHLSKKTFIEVQKEYHLIPKLTIQINRVSPEAILKDGDIVFVDASEDDNGTSRHLVISNPTDIPFISGLHTIVAKSNNHTLDNLFKRYCFQSLEIKKQFRFFSVGTKVSGINKSNIVKLHLSAPPLPEQQAIAAILSDMDAEITTLESRRDKTKLLKQGMMQELLTGRIRLIPPAAHAVSA